MKKNPDNGFTLIELILYISIVSIMLTGLIPFAWNIIGGSVKSSTQQELSSQARFLSERIKSEIRNAKDISYPISPTSLTIQTDSGSTVISYDSASGKVRINKNASGNVDLNSADTKVTGFTFSDYSSADRKTKNIQFSFTMGETYSGPRQEYKTADVIIQGSAEVRSN